jgi:hypothetical protein
VANASSSCSKRYGAWQRRQIWHHPLVPGSPPFDEWYERIVRPTLGSEGPRDSFEQWCRDVFADHGEVDLSTLEALYRADRIRLCRAAVALVSRDLAATTSLDPMIEVVDDDDFDVYVSYRGNFTSGQFSFDSAEEAARQVADDVQEHVSEDLWQAWPMCPTHDRGLHAVLIEGAATWRCSAGRGGHPVAAIGHLG